MPGTKKILITTETHEQFILRVVGGTRAFGRCLTCGREVEMLTIDQAVSFTGTRALELLRLGEKRSIHTLETDQGHLLFCRDSLEKALPGHE